MKENIYDEAKPMSGGQKRMWLRIHRDEVLDFFEMYGEEATRVKYSLVKHGKWDDSLASLLKGSRVPFTGFGRADGRVDGLSDGLEIRIQIAESVGQDLRVEVRELKEAFGNFQDTVSEQLRKSFLLPLLQALIKLNPSFEPHPELDAFRLDMFAEPPKMIEGENIEQMQERHQKEIENLRINKLKESYLSAHPFAQPIVTELTKGAK